MKPERFNIRVYALIVEQGKILLTDEIRFGIRMTKFPGGGLKFGEGTIDCLRREIKEEMDAEIENITHFYTTDFFQETRFTNPPSQLISIYYHCRLADKSTVDFTDKPFDFDKNLEGAQVFRWISLQDLQEEKLTLPVDKVVLKRLQR